MNNPTVGHYLVAFLIFIIATLVWGCSSVKTVTEYYPVYKEVKVPVRCTVELPIKPKYQGDVIMDNLNILRYTEELQNVLGICTK